MPRATIPRMTAYEIYLRVSSGSRYFVEGAQDEVFADQAMDKWEQRVLSGNAPVFERIGREVRLRLSDVVAIERDVSPVSGAES